MVYAPTANPVVHHDVPFHELVVVVAVPLFIRRDNVVPSYFHMRQYAVEAENV